MLEKEDFLEARFFRKTQTVWKYFRSRTQCDLNF